MAYGRSRSLVAGKADLVFDVINYAALCFVGFVTLYPFWNVLILSISTQADALRMGWRFMTFDPDFSAYETVFQSAYIWRGFYNTVKRVVIGAAIGVVTTLLIAYPLSKKDLPFNRLITVLLLFTMMYNGGIIPNYILIKTLRLRDTIWCLVLPSSVAAYHIIIMRNFFKAIPASMEESGVIDGASTLKIWFLILLPLSAPAIATITLWVVVGHWNRYLDALIYITDRSKYVFQIIVRRVLLEDQIEEFLETSLYAVEEDPVGKPTSETMKAAVIMVGTLPLVMIYPFLQRFFVKGIMLGAVKG